MLVLFRAVQDRRLHTGHVASERTGEQIGSFVSTVIGEQRGAALPLVGDAVAEPCKRAQAAADERGGPGRGLSHQRPRPEESSPELPLAVVKRGPRM